MGEAAGPAGDARARKGGGSSVSLPPAVATLGDAATACRPRCEPPLPPPARRQTYGKLVAEGTIVPAPDIEVPGIPIDLETATKQGKVRPQSPPPSLHPSVAYPPPPPSVRGTPLPPPLYPFAASRCAATHHPCAPAHALLHPAPSPGAQLSGRWGWLHPASVPAAAGARAHAHCVHHLRRPRRGADLLRWVVGAGRWGLLLWPWRPPPFLLGLLLVCQWCGAPGFLLWP